MSSASVTLVSDTSQTFFDVPRTSNSRVELPYEWPFESSLVDSPASSSLEYNFWWLFRLLAYCVELRAKSLVWTRSAISENPKSSSYLWYLFLSVLLPATFGSLKPVIGASLYDWAGEYCNFSVLLCRAILVIGRPKEDFFVIEVFANGGSDESSYSLYNSREWFIELVKPSSRTSSVS